MLQFLHLPLFVPTFFAILTQPLGFFREYYQLVTTRKASFWDINAEEDSDHYLSPVKFAALALALSNLIFPLILALGTQAGVFSPEYAAFADWAEEQGYLDSPQFTGIGIVDDVLREIIVLLMFYGLGHLIALLSRKRIPARFAAGYFFYWGAWGLLGSLTQFVMVLLSSVMPGFPTRVYFFLDGAISLAAYVMFLVFPILYWPRILDISKKQSAIALLGGLAIWIPVIAIVATVIVDVPDIG